MAGLYKKVPYVPKLPPIESLRDEKVQNIRDYISKNRKKATPSINSISPHVKEEYDNWFKKF